MAHYERFSTYFILLCALFWKQKFLGEMPAILGVDIMYHAVALNSLSQDY